MKFSLLWRGQFQGLLSLLASDSDDKLLVQIIRLMPDKNQSCPCSVPFEFK